uniref:Uncharacterized protein n=2 Tax=Eukaryota TaxID=2759 RepID=A0A7S3QDE8_9STRA
MHIFSQAVLAALSFVSTQAVHQQSDIYYHEKPVLGPSMWHFSADGVTIYAPNGDVLKEHPKKMTCRPYMTRSGVMSEDCYYYAWASDGHKYVWAASFAGDHHVEAFDIDTGDYAGYINTCSTPIDMEYHPARREMYVRCAQSTDTHPGEIDVFSSANLSSDIPMIKFGDTVRPYGRLAVHSAMGPYAYSLAYDQSYITELDLSSKLAAATYEIPDAFGGYDTTYSPVNNHLYFRARVCCSCGVDADVESCGYGAKQVLVKTGPSKSTVEQDGVCGSGCEGSVADTIGVYEFDTINKKFVTNHNIKSGTGFGADPVSSPDGKWILLLPNDGGQYVRVLKAGGNGSSSTLVTDIKVNFEGGTPGKTVVSDFAFIQQSDRDILVLGASSDNHVVLIDLRSNQTNMDMVKLDLAPGVSESTGGSSRKLEWAVGTDYVWVDGGESMEQYIIKIPDGISSAKVDRTLGAVTAGNMLYVNNYERLRSADAMLSVSRSASATSGTGTSTSTQQQMETTSDGVGMAAVVIGSVGLVTALGAIAYTFSKSSSSSPSADAGGQEQFRDDLEAKSLGSKDVA